MLNRARKFVGKQRVIPWVGEFKETLAQAAFWVTPVNFVMLAGTFYFTTLRNVAPWITLPMYMTVALVGGLIILVLEFKFITPSIWKFRGKQMDLDGKKSGGKVVVVSGGFDPLNGIGHASHIREAKKLGDILIVILSRDDQLIAKGNKKSGTFYPSLADRIAIMQEMADQVVVNIDKDSTCAETLRLIRPNVFAKGGDRTPSNMPESEILACKEIGCEIIYNVGEDKRTSSSELVNR